MGAGRRDNFIFHNNQKLFMQARYIALLIVIIIVLLFILGAFVSEQCITIGKDKACWKTTVILVESPFCPNATEPCLAKPELQQHNAIADLLVKACDRAKANAYAENSLNERIEEVVNLYMGLDIGASQLCEQPGMVLTHRLYE